MNTQKHHPELSAVAQEVQRWLNRHERNRYLDVITLSRDLSDHVDPLQIAKFLYALGESGEAHVVYKVLSPDNVIVDETFDCPQDVPYWLCDNLGRPFEVDPSRILPIYQIR